MTLAPNPFDLAHEALRRSSFATADALARTDFLDPLARRRALLDVHGWLALLQDHTTREDLDTLPTLLPHDRPLVQALAREHLQLEADQRQVRQAALGLDDIDSDSASAAVLGQAAELRRAVYRLIAGQLMHLDREESEALAILQAQLDQPALTSMRQRLAALILPAGAR